MKRIVIGIAISGLHTIPVKIYRRQKKDDNRMDAKNSGCLSIKE